MSPSAPASASLPRICVAVAAETIDELLRQSSALLPAYPFQELRLDYLPIPAEALPALGKHWRAHPEAIFLVTCRTVRSGGRWNETPATELDLLEQAAHTGAPWVDLSLESAEVLGPGALARLRAAGAKVVLSWHDFHATGELAPILDRLRGFAPDLAKIVPTAQRLDDTSALFELLQTASGPPLVAVAMGEAGIPSRILAPRFGAAFTFAASNPAAATAPGQMTAATLRELYRVERISPETRIYGVAGMPIRSSLSPLMLNTAFAAAGLDAVDVPLLTEEAAELLRLAHTLELAGCSVTMPLKQAVLPFLGHVDELAARIGAVNTLRREPDGSYSGFNTDAAGITEPLRQRLSLRGARVLVVGAGGAARAAVFGCRGAGASVWIMNRSPEPARRLAAEAGAHAIFADRPATSDGFDVVIQATPAGMGGNAGELPVDLDTVRAGLVYDLVYNPLETPLLQEAARRGIATLPGIEMFVHQGARQFELWTGHPAPVEAMRRVVLEHLAQQHLPTR